MTSIDDINMDNYERRKYKINIWIDRPALLDVHDERSAVNRYKFKGFVYFFIALTWLYIITRSIREYYETGRLFKYEKLGIWFHKPQTLFGYWFLLCCFSILSYILVYIKFKMFTRMPSYIISSTHYLLQIYLLIKFQDAMVNSSYEVVPSAFLATVFMVNLMKGHAYLHSNIKFSKKSHPYNKLFLSHITLKNFIRFYFMPTFVYDINYAITKHKFRIDYFIYKCISIVMSLLGLLYVAAYEITPIMADSYKHSILYNCCALYLPCIAAAILTFYLGFESIANACAEATGFADRQFYQDWWNCSTYEELSRKWNVLVHKFLLYYVYHPIYSNRTILYKILALIVTYFISSLFHEIFLQIVLKVTVNWFIVFMLFQLPLMPLTTFMKGKTIGIVIFWYSLIIGIALLASIYGVEWSIKNFGTI